jgi:hypothetical protein
LLLRSSGRDDGGRGACLVVIIFQEALIVAAKESCRVYFLGVTRSVFEEEVITIVSSKGLLPLGGEILGGGRGAWVRLGGLRRLLGLLGHVFQGVVPRKGGSA